MSSRSRTIATATIIAAGLVVSWCESGKARQAPRPGPERGRYSDPYLNVHTWPGAGQGNHALFYFMAAQRRAAETARAEQSATSGMAMPSGSPHHLMNPGGSASGSYFGRTTITAPHPGPAPPARYNRYGHYFGNRGR